MPPLQIYATQNQWRAQVVEALGGADLAADATEGFFYVPTCNGTPTGTPEAQPGKSPVVVDAVNHLIYFYSGGSWRTP